MIQFPETATTEWKIVAEAANAEAELRARIQRATLVENELEKLRIRHEATEAFQHELDADLTPALEMSTLATHKANPAAAPTDLIDGVLKDNGLCIVIGPAGSGKSTSALQMLYSLHTGEDWMGQSSVQLPGSMGVLSYDMDGAMVFDWMSGFPNIDPSKFSVVNAYKRGNPLAVPSMRAQIASTWKANNVGVVVVDSFSASFFGQDQNDSAGTMAHYRDLIKFALTECEARALVVIAHSTVASPHKIRGSTVHHDVADSIVGQVEDPKTGSREMRMVKYRAALGQHQMNPVVLTAPDSVTHLVELDAGGMNLAGMTLPPQVAASMNFPPLPNATSAPDLDGTIDSDDEQEADL